ncbi:MAG: SEC-C metal-binding domain-containing protein [Anaerolineae bacterium]|jgi:hypothetical protein|nr:SEC-C metal-binding domain-containing protein [Anaerolineae bacterium]
MNLYLSYFGEVDPELASRETRALTLLMPQRGVPAGKYAIVESYCADPACDCRRVMLTVIEEHHPHTSLASINYAFDADDPDPGPFLDPLNPMSAYAQGLMELVTELVLSDPAYLARLERHYALTKQAAADPTHPAYETLRKSFTDDVDEYLESPAGAEAKALLSRTKIGRNAPCPCGSGKKYKACCGRKG